MHHKSWSNLRRILEEERLCTALRGRVQYFMTRYHDAHDEYGRFCIRVDGIERLNASIYQEEYEKGGRRKREQRDPDGKFAVWEVGDALDIYMDELTVDEALVSRDTLVRLFAVLDRRVGKRRLPALAAAMQNEPEWLQFFYRLRLEAEGYKSEIRIVLLNRSNFRVGSLDAFIRHQEVTECWRNVDGEWRLCPIAFTEEWDHARLREEAAELLCTIDAGIPVVGAFDGAQLIGYVQLGKRLGSRKQYIELAGFHVSAPYRRQGIGKRLFSAICGAASALGAEKLYISAHSSKESQAAYRALGCVNAQEIDAAHAAAEPYDVQMEYDLMEESSHE